MSFRISSGTTESQLPGSEMTFEVVCETNVKLIYRLIQRALQDYREDHKGPTFCAIQSTYSIPTLLTQMPGLYFINMGDSKLLLCLRKNKFKYTI